jgi:hypothetical protein
MEAILTAANFGRYSMEILTDLGLLPMTIAALPQRVSPCIVYTDNLGAQQIHNGSSNIAAKHGWISRTISWVREVVSRGELIVHHVPRAENPSDTLTKFLHVDDWYKALDSIPLHSDPMTILIQTLITKRNRSKLGDSPNSENPCSGPGGAHIPDDCQCWAYSNGAHSRRTGDPAPAPFYGRQRPRLPFQKAVTPTKALPPKLVPPTPPYPQVRKRGRTEEDQQREEPL